MTASQIEVQLVVPLSEVLKAEDPTNVAEVVVRLDAPPPQLPGPLSVGASLGSGARADLLVERFVGRTRVPLRVRAPAEMLDRAAECARDASGRGEGLSPKEVAQVRILPGALL